MKSKEKILTIGLVLGILNLAFWFGKYFYFAEKPISAPHPATPSALSMALAASLDQKFVLLWDKKEIPVDQEELKKWVEPYFRSYTGQNEYRLNQQNIKTYLGSLANELRIDPVNARLVIENGKITEFTPARSGRAVNIDSSTANIMLALMSAGNPPLEPGQANSAHLVVNEIKPEITSEKADSLGINALLGLGESNFAGSPGPRVNNIKVGAKTFTGILMKPGEEFSFNNQLGTVDASTGYQPELVIKNNKLIPEFGGGICQVSTTLFRAVVAAGLPILERHPHSLPVRYYNPQGFDAAVYLGSVDLRFKNDTAGTILIQSKVNGTKLYFEIYGTQDGRKITIDGPHSYDINPDGSMKAILTRTIVYPDGTQKKDTFRSAYKSPSLFPTVRNPLE